MTWTIARAIIPGRPPEVADAALKPPFSPFDPRTLDAGRILAASTVFYFHVGLWGGCPLSRYGEFAVEYFVVLSGITYHLFTGAKPGDASGYFSYLWRRVSSLLPLFVLTNAALYAGSLLYPSGLGRAYTPAEFLASATGISMYLGWKYLSMVMWFIPFIVQVYCLLPLLDRLARWMNPVWLTGAAFLFSFGLSQAAAWMVQDPATLAWTCKNWSPLFRLPEVCAGVILGRAAAGQGNWPSVILAVALFGALSAAVSGLRAAGAPLAMYLPWGGFVVPLVLFAASVLISPLARRVDVRTLRLLGLSSFAFYLIHAAPLAAINRLPGPKPAILAAYFLVCWLAAVGLTGLLAKIGPRKGTASKLAAQKQG